MIIENSTSILNVDLLGGAYTDFHLKSLPLNPLDYRFDDPENALFQGHFACFDRWGPASAREKEYGYTHHGEAVKEIWKLLRKPSEKDGKVNCSIMCRLPMGKLELTRKITLYKDHPVLLVTENIRNLNKFGRIYNLVQHVTIGPPFLDRSVVFDSNAEKGFEDKLNGDTDQEKPEFKWPEAHHNGQKVNLQQFHVEWPMVSSFIFNRRARYGWVTACNAKKGLLLGYVWKTADYPWLNFWRSMADSVPRAFGMEFGTTGLHEPFPVLTKKGKIFDRNIFEYIDADETVSKSFIAFLARIPDDYQGVRNVQVTDNSLFIRERSNQPNDIKYSIK